MENMEKQELHTLYVKLPHHPIVKNCSIILYASGFAPVFKISAFHHKPHTFSPFSLVYKRVNIFLSCIIRGTQIARLVVKSLEYKCVFCMCATSILTRSRQVTSNCVMVNEAQIQSEEHPSSEWSSLLKLGALKSCSLV